MTNTALPPNWEERKCETCGRTFTCLKKSKARYCSGTCKRSENRPGVVKHEITCSVCGKTFYATDRRRRYCSKECLDEGNRRNNRNRYHREAVKRCIVCGAILEGNQSKYCSDSCKRVTKFEASKDLFGARALIKPSDKKTNYERCECESKLQCIYGRGLSGTNPQSKQLAYCAYFDITGQIRGGYPDECTHFEPRGTKAMGAKFYTKKCGWCGKEFRAKRNTYKYCCKECAGLANVEMNKAKRKKPTEQVACAWCGKMFLPPTSRVKYCSDGCSEAAKKKQRREWNRRNR